MQKPYTFTEIPAVEDLLPNTGGQPGVSYALVSTDNLRRAQDEGWERLKGNNPIFTLEGPKGSANFELWGFGKPIVGQDPNSTRCVSYIDKALREKTGLGAQPEPPAAAPPKKDR